VKQKAFVSSFGLAAAFSFSAGFAHAEEPAAGTMQFKAATSGKEDVATSGFEAAAKAEAESKDATELKLSAGGLLASGNSRSLSATGSEKFRARRGDNQLSIASAANYGRAASSPDADVETTVENYQAKGRYDRFLAPGFALFGSMSALRDRFQGLVLRLNVDPGLAVYFVDQSKQQLWLELGYDFQYDVRRDEAIRRALEVDNIDLAKTKTRHSGRAFLGYSNTLNEAVTLDTGLEYLQAVKDTENYRLNWNIAINSQLSGKFSLATAFTLKYDHHPVPGVKTTDTLTSLSLVYQLL
jgi:putative salt-induced outer membrane protein YdiY